MRTWIRAEFRSASVLLLVVVLLRRGLRRVLLLLPTLAFVKRHFPKNSDEKKPDEDSKREKMSFG